MPMSAKRTVSLLTAVILAGFISGYQALCQDMGPGPEMGGPDGGGAPQQDTFDPDNPPKPPIPPDPEKKKPLEPDMGWLETRKELIGLYDGIIEAQFGDMRRRLRPTANPLLQRFREYWSEKNIVSEWSRTRPLGHDWSYPIPEVDEQIKEIQDTLTRELEAEAIKKYPELTREQYLAEGEKIYALYKSGDRVEFQLLSGSRGVSPKVRGVLRKVDKNVIVLNPRKLISRFDMPREVAARFFPEDHVNMVKEYADKAKQGCETNRRNYVHIQSLKQMPERLLAANYVPDHIRFGESYTTKIFKIDQWVSRKYLVMERQRQQWEANIGPRSIGESVFRAFMNGQGFRFVTQEESVRLGQALRQDEVNRHVGWVPVKDIIAMEQKLKDMEAYQVELEQYKTALEQYNRDKAEWDRRKKEWDAQGGGAGAAAADDDD